MAVSRKTQTPSKTTKRRASTPKPRVKRPVPHAAVATPEQPPSAPTLPEPILVLGSHVSGPEVLILDPVGVAPIPTPSFRPLAWGVSIALMTATIVGGLQLGYSLKGWVAQTRDRENVVRQAAEELESAPPRRGDAWNPNAPRSVVDRAAQTASREPAPKVSTQLAAEEDRPWPHLTALMGEGIRLHRDGWYGPAMARFREAVAVMPDYLRAYLWLGRSGLKAGRYDEARRALQQVIALDPQSAAAQEAKALLSQIEKDN